jgi:hypothetical protein
MKQYFVLLLLILTSTSYAQTYSPTYSTKLEFKSGIYKATLTPSSIIESYTLKLPEGLGNIGQVLGVGGSDGQLGWFDLDWDNKWGIQGNIINGSGTDFIGSVNNEEVHIKVRNGSIVRNSLVLGTNKELYRGDIAGESVGGTRGEFSVDLQVLRGASTQIASGRYSTISGGYTNTASGEQSSVVGGHTNTASGIGSFVGGGELNTVRQILQAVILQQSAPEH